MDLPTIRESIKAEEGLSLRPYLCPAGHLTIGYGHRITHGEHFTLITKDQASSILDIDISIAVHTAALYLGAAILKSLSDARQHAIIDMAFNMGLARLAGFARLRAAILAGDFTAAAAEILDSKYAKSDVPFRAQRNANRMLTGKEVK